MLLQATLQQVWFAWLQRKHYAPVSYIFMTCFVLFCESFHCHVFQQNILVHHAASIHRGIRLSSLRCQTIKWIYMWVSYGVVKPNSILVATINGFGSVLELVYVTIFLIFAPPRTRVSW